jgi:hypothetical protein
MKLSNNLVATGKLAIVLTDENGNIKHSEEVKNLVVDTGLDFIASRMTGTSANVMSHMGLGSGTTAAASGDTALQSPLGSRVALTVSGGSASDNTVTYVASFPAGSGTGAVTEAGVFNASTNGTMLCRTVFSVINKAAGDSMTITWTVTVE